MALVFDFISIWTYIQLVEDAIGNSNSQSEILIIVSFLKIEIVFGERTISSFSIL